MRGPDADRREARPHRAARACAPGHGAPSPRRQVLSQGPYAEWPMPPGAADQCRRSAVSSRLRRGQRRAAGRPHGRLGADADDVRNRLRGQCLAKGGDHAIAGIRDDRCGRHALGRDLRHLLKRDLPFGAELDGIGDARRPAAAPVLRPRLRQIQPVGDRHTRALVSPREAYRHLAVVLFAKHAAILAGHAHRVAALLGHAGVVDDPRRHRAVSLQGRQHGLTGRAQDGAIVPGGIGDEVMHRLMARAHVARIDARGHRLDALPLPGQTEPGDIGPQGAVPIPMAEGRAETLNIRVKPLGAGGPEVGHTWMLPAYPRNPLILLTQ